MDEFSLIENFFKSISSDRSKLVLTGIGDDAAVTEVPMGHELLVSTDTLVNNVHFLSDWPAEAIAYKAIASNVSDIAAMAGCPTWCSLALTLPSIDEKWLIAFSSGLNQALTEFNIDLIGGDMTRGPLTITITIHGIAPSGKSLKRNGAKVNDAIFVTGALGEGAYGVSQLGKFDYQSDVFTKLFYPKPRHAYAKLLQQYGSSAIDISDGLSSDLNHILKASGVGAVLFQEHLPLSSKLKKVIPKEQQSQYILNSGDEYELCFTVPETKKSEFIEIAHQKPLAVYEIGKITKDSSFVVKDIKKQITPILNQGFNHFKGKNHE